MSMQSTMRAKFAERLNELVDEGNSAGIDGLNIADILQRAATKAMKVCLSGQEGDQRDRACFELLELARQDLVDEAARKRTEGAVAQPRDW